MAKQVFEGLKVVEFANFAAGPMVSKYLADHGAEVIRVESQSRPDGFRANWPPFKDGKPGLNRSGQFAICNNSKLSVTLNLKMPEALDLAKRLVARSDIVVENMTPGAMGRLGLGYEDLKKVKADIIMLSSCNQGQTGPHANHPGFGSHLSSLSGFTQMIGYPDKPPMVLYGPYIDFIAVGYGLIAVVAALDYRRRTGKGQYIDLAQYESGLQFIAPLLLDFAVNNRIAGRTANRSPYSVPHSAYRCKGEDRWCVISVNTDEEWNVLCKVINKPEWVKDPRFATFIDRKQNEDELDRLIEEWTSGQMVEEVMEKLQGAGIEAGIVYHMDDLFSDPQLKRNFWWDAMHPEIGKHSCEGTPYILSKTPAEFRTSAPCIGEHNECVFIEMLGLSHNEYDALVKKGVIY